MGCLQIDGSVDVGHYLGYLHQKCNFDQSIVDSLNVLAGSDGNSDDAPATAPEPWRHVPRVVLMRRDSKTGPWMVTWVVATSKFVNLWLRSTPPRDTSSHPCAGHGGMQNLAQLKKSLSICKDQAGPKPKFSTTFSGQKS